MLVAIRFGRLAGMLGTVAAALIFAEFLFEPRLSLIVRDSAEKSNVIGILADQTDGADHQNQRCGVDRIALTAEHEPRWPGCFGWKLFHVA